MKANEQLALLRTYHPGIPDTGPTGSPFTECDITVDNNIERVQDIAGPTKPLQEYKRYEYDEDEDGEEYVTAVETVTLTDEAFAEAMAKYEADLEEWRRTNGVKFIKGPQTVTGSFVCADGTTCRGMGMGAEWRWTEWSCKS